MVVTARRSFHLATLNCADIQLPATIICVKIHVAAVPMDGTEEYEHYEYQQQQQPQQQPRQQQPRQQQPAQTSVNDYGTTVSQLSYSVGRDHFMW